MGGCRDTTEAFCRGTLCSDVVVKFLDANFVSWGAVSGRGEGSGMVAALQPGSFPFCAVVAPVSGESITVLQRVEGPVMPSEQRAAFRASAADEQVAAFRASGAEEEERRSALRLRQQQDAAYLESLRKDQEKERSAKSLQEPKPSPKNPGQPVRETTRAT